MSVTRVVVVDDHPLMLSGVVARLSVETDIHVVATASSCRGAIEAAAEHAPDVVLADVSMADGSMLDFLPELIERSPSSRVLLLTASYEPSEVATALERGAAGFLSKETPAADLPGHVRDVAVGRPVLDRRAASSLATHMHTRRTSPARLSPRELDVLRLVAEGLSNAEVGRRMFLATSTVKTHLEHAFEKLGVHDRTAAVARAKDLGLF